jgi:CheY-like chemotaxis protein
VPTTKGLGGENEAVMTSRILVIDDDEATLELYREFLQAEGFEPFLSLMSFDNLSEVAHLRPDLIILDAKINAQDDGLLFMQNLRRYPPTSAIPVILCTAVWQDLREQENVLRQKRSARHLQAVRPGGAPAHDQAYLSAARFGEPDVRMPAFTRWRKTYRYFVVSGRDVSLLFC